MRRLRLLLVILGISAMLPAWQASAATSPAPVRGPVHIMDSLSQGTLHPLFHAASQPAASCINGDCGLTGGHLSDLGGPIITTPTVYLVRFSNSPSTVSGTGSFASHAFDSPSPGSPSGAGAAEAALSSPYLDTQTQYARGGSFANATIGGVLDLYSPNTAGLGQPSNSLADKPVIDDNEIGPALDAAKTGAHLSTWDANTIFVMYFRSGQVITAGPYNSVTSFCAYHSALLYPSAPSSLNYVVMPNEDGAPGCAFTGSGATAFDNMTPVLSHELAETVTDPASPQAWFDTVHLQEIGDLCENNGPMAGRVTSNGFAYSLQYLWSNEINACIASQVPTTLSATAPAHTSVVATLTSSGSPIRGVSLSVSAGGPSIASGVTDASGKATITIPDLATGTTLTVAYAGSHSAVASTTTVGVAPPLGLVLSTPTSSMVVGNTLWLKAAVTPAVAGVNVVLWGPPSAMVSPTDANGFALFVLLPSAGAHAYAASASVSGHFVASSTLNVMVMTASSITASMSSHTNLSATLTTGGAAVPGATVTVKNGVTPVASGVTSSLGVVNVTIPDITQGTALTVSWSGSSSAAPASTTIGVRAPSSLLPGQILLPGQTLLSPNGFYRFKVETNGSLTIACPFGYTWSSLTLGSGLYLKLETNGNIILYNPSGIATGWSTHTAGLPVTRLTMQSDGNLVAYGAAGQPYWASSGVWGSGRLIH